MGFFDFLKGKTDNVWVDKNTNLMWQVDITLNLMTWYEAESYVKVMNQNQYCGFNNWRLPTIEEQEWIHRYKNLDIAWKYNKIGINPNNFEQAFFWSSTTLGERIGKILDLKSVTEEDLNNKAWNICISNAMSGYDNKTDLQCVRLIREL